MELKIAYASTPDILLRVVRDFHPVLRLVRRVCHTGVVVICAGLLLLGLLRPEAVDIGVLLTAIALIAGALFDYTGYQLWIRRLLRPYRDGPRPVTITMTEDECRFTNGERSSSCTWSCFAAVYRRGDFWALRLQRKTVIAVPVAAMDAIQTAAFIELVKGKGLLGD